MRDIAPVRPNTEVTGTLTPKDTRSYAPELVTVLVSEPVTVSLVFKKPGVVSVLDTLTVFPALPAAAAALAAAASALAEDALADAAELVA